MTTAAIPLSVTDVSKSYGDVAALDGVNLEIPAGTVMATLGPNGAGKTTLARVVAGLVKPDRGDVRIMGIDAVAHGTRARRHLGYAAQDIAVYPGNTVRENLVFFGRIAGLGSRAIASQVEALCTGLNMSDLVDRRAALLSGGQCRRLHTAVALIGRPALVLLDEPTAGVDLETRGALVELVRSVAAEGTAVCYTTHYLPEVEQLSAEVAFIDHGRIIATGHVDELMAKYTSSILTIRFDGPPPSVPEGVIDPDDPWALRIVCDSPGPKAAEILLLLGAAADRIVALDVARPSLDTVYFHLTGRALVDEAPVGPVAIDPVAGEGDR